MDQLRISCGSGCGSGVDQLWISCRSGVDQLWIGCGSGVDQLWIGRWIGLAVDQFGSIACQGGDKGR